MEEKLESYKTIILEAIETIKKTHDMKDPYWSRMIGDLVSDYNEYTTQERRSGIHTEESVVMDIGEILKEFFKEGDEDIN
jgi:hypothetical protein